MSPLQITSKDDLLAVYNGIDDKLATESQRAEAMEFIRNNDFPTRSDEAWRNTDVNPIFRHRYSVGEYVKINKEITQAYRIPNLENDELVFVNGYFSEEFSNVSPQSGITIKTMQQAKTENKQVFDAYYEQSKLKQKNIFTSFNTAFAVNGTFIHIGKGKNLQRPLHVVFLTDGDNHKTLSQSRNLIVADANSSAKLIFSYHSLSINYTLTNVATEIFLMENSEVELNNFQGEGDDASQINYTKVKQLRDSRFTCNTITLCGAIVRNDIQVDIEGENCETNLNGLYMPDREQHFDNYLTVNHNLPHCNSNQLYKGIIDNKANAVFFGKVLVARDAQKTNANQSNKNILLTDYAKVHSKPQLEIYADDVSCSHGSTTGQLDKEAIFYLQSRGINFERARVLMLYAFASEVINKLSIEEFRVFVNYLVDKRLNREKVERQCTLLNMCPGCYDN